MAANKLYINDGNVDIAIAELGIVSGKQQGLLGDLERDLILRTSGNIQVQVGNKFYPLNFNSQSITTGNATVVNSSTTILNKIADLSTLTYPGDGNYVYIRESGAFYITVDSTYVELNTGRTTTGPGGPVVSKVYLSFDDTQTLTGGEKLRVTLNAGGTINSINDILSYTPNDVYAGQLVYSLSESRHYHLVDVNNPSLLESWQEIYLNLNDGGTVLGPTTFATGGDGTRSLSSLHTYSSYPYKAIASQGSALPILSVGASDLSSGLAVWSNAGNVYLQSLAADGTRGINFVTNALEGQYYPLSMAKNSVGIGGPLDYNYALTVTFNSLFKNSAFFANNVTSPDYITGDYGQGFGLTRDTSNLWILEVDKLIVRKDHTNLSSNYITSGLNGANIYNYSVTIKQADYVESIPIYIQASTSGKYSDTSGTVKPLSSKSMYAQVIRTTMATIDLDPSTQAYQLIKLSYAIGDRNSSGGQDTSTTYNRAADGSYYTPVGGYRYDTGSGTFVADPAGTLLQINEISVYSIVSSSQASVAVGDLFYFKSWDENKGYKSAIYAEVVAIGTDSYYLYVYNGESLSVGMQLVKVGNSQTGGVYMQNNAADISNPFTELATGIVDFSNFYSNYYYEQDTDFPVIDELIDDSVSVKSTVRFKVGDLSNLVDTDLMLTSGQYGLYGDNSYVRGNFVLNQAKFNNVTVATVPNYQPFLMLGANGRLQQIDLTAKIAQWDTVTPQLQSDWLQTNTAALDYIKNKPTQLSQFTNNLQSLTNGYGITALSYNGSAPASVTIDSTVIAPINNPQFIGTMMMRLQNGGFGGATFTNLVSGQNFNIWRNMSSALDEVDFVSVPGITSGTKGGFAWYTNNANNGSSGGLVQNAMLDGVTSTLTVAGHMVFNGINAATSPTALAWYNPATKEMETVTAAQAATIIGSTGGGGGFTNPMTSPGDLIVGGTSGAANRLAAGSANLPLVSNGTSTAASWRYLPESGGGTGQTSYTSGDMLYATALQTLSKIGIGTSGQVLTVVSGAPSWVTPTGGGGTGYTGTPTISSVASTTVGTATGGTVTISGYNEAGYIVIHTGSTTTGIGSVCTISFGGGLSFPTTCVPVISIAGASLGTGTTVFETGVGPSGTTTSWNLSIDNTKLTANATYTIAYQVKGY